MKHRSKIGEGVETRALRLELAPPGAVVENPNPRKAKIDIASTDDRYTLSIDGVLTSFLLVGVVCGLPVYLLMCI